MKMKDLLDKIFSELRAMPPEEFSRAMSKYKDYPLALALEQIMEFGEGVQVLHKDCLTYKTKTFSKFKRKLMQIHFKELEICNAANDDRFCLAA